MRRVLVLLLVLGLVTACGDDDSDDGSDPQARQIPLVLVTAGDQTRQLTPARLCDLDVQDCAERREDPLTLPIVPDTPVRIRVPDLVSTTPWQVVFRYRGPGAAEAVEGRTPVFGAKEASEYTLTTPPGSQLELVEIQQFGLPAQENGQLTFPIRASWVLNVIPPAG